jgi:hypothetical protein
MCFALALDAAPPVTEFRAWPRTHELHGKGAGRDVILMGPTMERFAQAYQDLTGSDPCEKTLRKANDYYRFMVRV